MRSMEANSIDAICCDPPYGLEFMGKEWDKLDAGLPQENVWKGRRGKGGSNVGNDDTKPASRHHVSFGGTRSQFKRCSVCGKRQFSGTPCRCDEPQWEIEYPEGAPSSVIRMQRWHETWAREAYRVLKPGGHLVAFGGTRTSHRLVCAVEDAGFEVRDSLVWLYGSGFSKSWNFKTMYRDGFCGCAERGNALEYIHDEYATNDQSNGDVRDLREAIPEAAFMGQAEQEPFLLAQLQRQATGEDADPALAQRAGGVDGGERSVIPGEDERRAEPGLEGRALRRTREGVRDGSPTGPSTGAPQRLRAGTHLGCRGDDGATVESGRGSASQEPRPSGQPTGEPTGLPVAHRALDDGTLRNGGCCPRCGKLKAEYRGYGSGIKPAHEPIVLARKPLAGTVASTVARYGTGALNVDKCRVEGGVRPLIENAGGPTGDIYSDGKGGSRCLGTTTAGRWPPNLVLSHIGGPDGCVPVGTKRVKSGTAVQRNGGGQRIGGNGIYGGSNGLTRPDDGYADPDGTEEVTAWDCRPSCPVAELDRQSGKAGGGFGVRGQGDTAAWRSRLNGSGETRDRNSFRGTGEVVGYGDTGGASRFFPQCAPDVSADDPSLVPFRYVAKASRRERNAGLEGMPERSVTGYEGGVIASAKTPRAPGNTDASVANHHPTVKPVTLMRWLVRLVTPPSGVVLDCFAGSGSTGCAAVLEGFDFIGIEQDAEYAAIAERRIAHVARHGEDWLKAAGNAGVGKTNAYNHANGRKVQVCESCDRRWHSGASACEKCGGVLVFPDEHAERERRNTGATGVDGAATSDSENVGSERSKRPDRGSIPRASTMPLFGADSSYVATGDD
jgi:DNA modification methylase